MRTAVEQPFAKYRDFAVLNLLRCQEVPAVLPREGVRRHPGAGGVDREVEGEPATCEKVSEGNSSTFYWGWGWVGWKEGVVRQGRMYMSYMLPSDTSC